MRLRIVWLEPLEATFPDRQYRTIRVHKETDQEWIGLPVERHTGEPISFPKFAWKVRKNKADNQGGMGSSPEV